MCSLVRLLRPQIDLRRSRPGPGVNDNGRRVRSRPPSQVGAQLLLQAALEAEVTAFLGRDRYQRATTTEGAVEGCATGMPR
jgi:hypothetical protein